MESKTMYPKAIKRMICYLGRSFRERQQTLSLRFGQYGEAKSFIVITKNNGLISEPKFPGVAADFELRIRPVWMRQNHLFECRKTNDFVFLSRSFRGRQQILSLRFGQYTWAELFILYGKTNGL